MSKLKSLHDLLVDELRDLHHAESQLVRALPKMAKAAHAVSLREALDHHLEETKVHVRRLKKVFADLRANPLGKRCKAMEGLLAEVDDLILSNAEPVVRDAGLIAAAQRIEHYEVAAYGTAREFAATLGLTEIAATLHETEAEERGSDGVLTRVAKSINLAAAEKGVTEMAVW